MNDKYILNESGEPVKEPNLRKWAIWFETANRRVDETICENGRISTVFLGLDHNYSDEGPPILWETMVFGGALDQEQDRCSGNREQAEAMHEKMVALVRSKLTGEPRPLKKGRNGRKN